jgi:DNA-binding transcriptional LysR family regulator
VTPTEAGVLLAERARLILKDATGLLEAVREVAADPQGSLHVVVPVGLPPQATAALLKLVNQMLPRLRLHLTLAIDPLAALGDDVDLAFYFGARAATGRWRSLDVVTIEQQLMASPKWLEVHGVPKTLEALAHVPLLRWEEPGVDSNTLPLRDGSSLSLRPHVVSPDIYLLRQCALDSMGVAFVPEGSTIPSIGAEPLVPVLPDLVGRALPVRIAVPASHSELPRVRALFDLLQRFLSVRV